MEPDASTIDKTIEALDFVDLTFSWSLGIVGEELCLFFSSVFFFSLDIVWLLLD